MHDFFFSSTSSNREKVSFSSENEEGKIKIFHPLLATATLFEGIFVFFFLSINFQCFVNNFSHNIFLVATLNLQWYFIKPIFTKECSNILTTRAQKMRIVSWKFKSVQVVSSVAFIVAISFFFSFCRILMINCEINLLCSAMLIERNGREMSGFFLVAARRKLKS